ncbi:MAG: hypothetical protein ACHQ50_04855 [Fimbriimonadales bacterium]
MTLSGREAPNTKRIDVEANLLQEWLVERRVMKREIQLRLAAVAGIFAVGLWCVASLREWNSSFKAKERPVAQRLKAVQNQYTAMIPASTGISDAELQKMVDTARNHADALMGQVIALMNTASASMALASMKVDVLGGEVKVTGQADAENYYAANEFIQRNNDPSKGINATQVSTSRSDLLATDGVSFQFVKKVKVSQ